MLLLQVSFTSTLRGTFGTTPPQPAHSTTRSTSRPAATTEPRSTKETATSNTHSRSVKGAWAPRGGNKLLPSQKAKQKQFANRAVKKSESGIGWWREGRRRWCQGGKKSESDVEGRREWRWWKRLCGTGWRGVGDGITINKTFSLNDVSLNGKSNTQISWVGLLIFKIYSLEKNFHFPFLA